MVEHTKLHFVHYLHIVYEGYRKNVQSGEMAYSHYCSQFLDVYELRSNGVELGIHNAVMKSLAILLLKRQKLVEHYFSKDVLSEEDFISLQKAHYSTDPGKHAIEKVKKVKEVLSDAETKAKAENLPSDIGININPRQLDAIAKWLMIDDKGRRILSDHLTAENVKQFFAGRFQLHVKTKQNLKIATKMFAMEEKSLIVHEWRAFVIEHSSIITANTNAAITKGSIYHSQSQGRNSHADMTATFMTDAARIRDLE